MEEVGLVEVVLVLVVEGGWDLRGAERRKDRS